MNFKILAALLLAIPAVSATAKFLSDNPRDNSHIQSEASDSNENTGTSNDYAPITKQRCGELQTLVKSVANPTEPDTKNTSKRNKYGIFDWSTSAQGYVTFTAECPECSVLLETPDGILSPVFTVSNGGTVKAPLTGGTGEYRFIIVEKRPKGRPIKLLHKHVFSVSKIDSDLAPYLVSTPYGDYENAPKAVAVANEIWNANRTSYGNVSAIAQWICENLEYDEKFQMGVLDLYMNPDEIIEAGGGICVEFSKTLVAMLRSQGVPAYLQRGTVEEGYDHAWVMAWIECYSETKNDTTYSTGSWMIIEPTIGMLLNPPETDIYIPTDQQG